MTRPTQAEINLNALRHNLKELRRITDPIAICATVKADAYGHSGFLVSKVFSEMGINYWGVHCLEEAIELRAGGIEGTIILLGGAYANEIPEIKQYQLTPAIHSLENLNQFVSALKRTDSPLKVHIKLDTGMGRLGIREENLPKFLETFAKQKVLKMGGVFGHLPLSENKEMTLNQGKVFDQCIDKIKALGFSPGLRHHTNSLASILYPEMRYDLIRPGLILYGIYPGDPLKEKLTLKPVMTFTSKVISIREIPKGVGLSYGHTYITSRDSRIATIPVGYADGYPRLLSNQAEVLIQGKRMPVVGRVCMDMTLIDVSDLPQVQIGERVILFGEDQGQEINVCEIADKAKTLSYEILCGISPRVPRIPKEE